MRIERNGATVTVSASPNDTYQWARRHGAVWPCSQLAGRRFVATFHRGNLVDLTVDGRYGTDVDANEFNAFIADHKVLDGAA